MAACQTSWEVAGSWWLALLHRFKAIRAYLRARVSWVFFLRGPSFWWIERKNHGRPFWTSPTGMPKMGPRILAHIKNTYPKGGASLATLTWRRRSICRAMRSRFAASAALSSRSGFPRAEQRATLEYTETHMSALAKSPQAFA